MIWDHKGSDLSRLLRVIVGAIDVLFYNAKKISKFHPRDVTLKPQADTDCVLDQSKISNELIMVVVYISSSHQK